MSELIINNRSLRLIVNPERGMSVMAFFARRGDDWLAIMPDTRDGSSDLASASFLMMPYSNRVEDGRFVFEGKNTSSPMPRSTPSMVISASGVGER